MKFDLLYTPSGMLPDEGYKATPEVWKVSAAASVYCQLHKLPIEKEQQLVDWLKQIPKEERLKCLLCPVTNEYIWTDDFETHWKRGELFAPIPHLFKSFEDLLAFSHNPTHKGQILLSKDADCTEATLIMRYEDPTQFRTSPIHYTLTHWGVNAFKNYCPEAKTFCERGENRMPAELLRATFLVAEGKHLGQGAYKIFYGFPNATEKWVIDPTGNSFILNWQLTPQEIRRKRVELTGRM